MRLLQHILFEDGNPEDNLSSRNAILDRLQELGCAAPVEPELLGMLANARNLGLVLVIVGRDTEQTRPRVLNDKEKLWSIGRMIPWLDVFLAGEARIQIPKSSHRDDNIIQAKAKEFELKMALWLQDHDQSLRCRTPPHRGQCGEQIDIYGYKDEGTTVIVGECKLRREGNEAKSIERTEIQQLRRKVIAARSYEEKRRPGNSGNQVVRQFQGIFVSNANKLDEGARQLIDSEQAFNIQVLTITLQSGWETKQEWAILQQKSLYPADVE